MIARSAYSVQAHSGWRPCRGNRTPRPARRQGPDSDAAQRRPWMHRRGRHQRATLRNPIARAPSPDHTPWLSVRSVSSESLRHDRGPLDPGQPLGAAVLRDGNAARHFPAQAGDPTSRCAPTSRVFTDPVDSCRGSVVIAQHEDPRRLELISPGSAQTRPPSPKSNQPALSWGVDRFASSLTNAATESCSSVIATPSCSIHR